MERTVDQIRKAEAAVRELLEAAAHLRREVEIACARNPEQTAELRTAAARFEAEAHRIDESLRAWKQGIQ